MSHPQVRLTSQQIAGIVDGVAEFVQGGDAELRLHGSRVDLDRKGGDIDLLLITPSDRMRDTLMQRKHHLLSAIKKNIGDQKIDLTRSDTSLSSEAATIAEGSPLATSVAKVGPDNVANL